MAEWSKALVLGTSLFGGVGSNPTAAKKHFAPINAHFDCADKNVAYDVKDPTSSRHKFCFKFFNKMAYCRKSCKILSQYSWIYCWFGETHEGEAVEFRNIIQQVSKTFSGSGGIRTHASEETGALNQRLRPLGHATVVTSQ